MPKYKEKWGLTTELQNSDFLEYVGQLNNIKATLEEIIKKELIYK
ncbi:MAG: TnpV protein [Clostridioides sp.]|nr:TnpV protein [Clostridioides sp.]